MFLFQAEGVITGVPPRRKTVEATPQDETINRESVSKVQTEQKLSAFKTATIAYIEKSNAIPQEDKPKIIENVRATQTETGVLRILEDVRDKYHIKDNLLDDLINQLKKAVGGAADNVDIGALTQQNQILSPTDKQTAQNQRAKDVVDGFFKAA